MDFATAVRTVILKRYADFQGRASRSEFWWFTLFAFLLNIVLQVITGLVPILGIIAIVIMLAVLIPSIAVAVRRLHDIGKSGWWYLLVFIPLIGALVLIYWFVQPGQSEDNQWGANPLGAGHGH
jgi:uncharacterized membrane protein YhaH (DUF805 family)